MAEQPTQGQRDARARNWRIYRLRALYNSVGALDADLARDVQLLVDQQLGRLGAQSCALRDALQRSGGR